MDLSGLNKNQKEAVLYNDGPLMMLAGAGSGKTRTLVKKICYLLEEKKINSFQILAVTFSNKAAKEMRERVASESNLSYGALQITTFHAFCAQVLRSEATYLGLSRNFTIYDSTESKAVAKTILSRHGITKKQMSPFELLYFIDDIKNNGFYEGRENTEYEPDKEDILYTYYKEYEHEIHKSNSVDFGGLIVGVIQLFERFPEVLEKYQRRFEYILVDEYQDTNRAQFDLICLLSGDKKNICVVGDEDQSIYSWRGADIRNILDFEKYFPNSELIKLEQNYRSSKNIIEAASHVIARNQMRKGKEMWTDNSEGEEIKIIECESDLTEGEFVSDKINELIASGVEQKDIAVFYRSNAQSRIIEDALRRTKVSYRVIGGIKFYDRKEIKDLLSYMRLVVNEKDSFALTRVVNVPARGIGATTLRKLESEALRLQLSLWEVIDQISSKPGEFDHLKISKKAKSALFEFANLINEMKVLEEEKEYPSTIYEKVLHESGYHDYLKANKDYESMARLENLDELANAIIQYEDNTQNPSLNGFLETITLDQNTEEGDNSKGGDVSLMTVHGSKGLEFPYVFLVGAEENIFPSFQSLDSGAMGMEEERRLFYVAMTRAMKNLFITFSSCRMLYGTLRYNPPSCFIHEIPNKYYTWHKITKDGKSVSSNNEPKDFDDEFNQDGIDYGDEFNQDSSSDSNYNDDFDGAPVYEVRKKAGPRAKSSATVKKASKKGDPSFPKGSCVAHSIYGEGFILETEGFGQDEKVLVKFENGNMKRFMVKYAPLVLI